MLEHESLPEAVRDALRRQILDTGLLQTTVEAKVRFHGQTGVLVRASIDRQHLALKGVRARHEPVREALRPGTARQIEKTIYAHYVTDRDKVPVHVLAGADGAPA